MIASDGMANLGDVRLRYWDTGGDGEVLVLLHPGTGSHAIWEYQRALFIAAGYRVIGYSRRGHYESDMGTSEAAASDDLGRLADFLAVDRFHLLGVAAGGIVAIDFAISRSNRLLSLVLAGTIGGVTDPIYAVLSKSLRPDGFEAMPASFQELGPSYRATNPEGVARWEALEHLMTTRLHQPLANNITFAALERITARTLLLTGDADLWMPPGMLPMFAERIKGSQTAVIANAGHATYWEQPEIFGQLVLRFLSNGQ
jgi:pimeloyl-ACP methyl ester carboxylesterase